MKWQKNIIPKIREVLFSFDDSFSEYFGGLKKLKKDKEEKENIIKSVQEFIDSQNRKERRRMTNELHKKGIDNFRP